MLFFETSCKDGTNVELAVMTMVAKIMENKEAQSRDKAEKATHSDNNSRSCCIA